MKFVDECTLLLSSGKGGAGACSFRREKFVPRGGPDGGDGGNGGSIIFEANQHIYSLLDLVNTRTINAEDGGSGGARQKHGKNGKNVIVYVPRGTEILDEESGNFLAYLEEDQQQFTLLKGGRGGKGNAFFKTAQRQVPRFSQPGETGSSQKVRLILTLLADIGLVGLPNAGKSSLLKALTSATPEIGSYPFTTLSPQLGVLTANKLFKDLSSENVSNKSGRITIADIPGIIEDAHLGKGLGITFLRHVERTRLLLHMVEATWYIDGGIAELVSRYQVLNQELSLYDKCGDSPTKITAIPKRVAISKCDLIPEAEDREIITKEIQAVVGVIPMFISSETFEGLESLVKVFADFIEVN
jgi:GTPase